MYVLADPWSSVMLCGFPGNGGGSVGSYIRIASGYPYARPVTLPQMESGDVASDDGPGAGPPVHKSGFLTSRLPSTTRVPYTKTPWTVIVRLPGAPGLKS